MDNKVPMEFSPFVSPDSLRTMLTLSKNMYDMHVDKYKGYEDINGSKYEGTVENFGSELLIESRKLLLDKPCLKNIFIKNNFKYYFNIDYADYVNTYDQQNMLSAILKKDVLLSNKTYQIKFDNISIVNIPRSRSSSDPNVIKDSYIKTTTPPTLIITDENDNVEELSLVVSCIDESNITYYFHINYYDTADIMAVSYDDLLNLTSVTTNPITNNMNGREFVWICIDKLKTLPDINFVNNDDLLTIGMNGHDDSLIYPIMNYNDELHDNEYIIKIIPSEGEMFVENDSIINYSSKIEKIQLLHYTDEHEFNPSVEPESIIEITYDDTYSKLSLNKFINDNIDTDKFIGKWFFKKPTQNDYDYDGRYYKNRCYAYTNLFSFINNTLMDSVLIPGLKVHFSSSYLFINEELCGNAYAGLHLNNSSDNSKNAIDKKNGIIHNIGDFDGLPPYFKYMLSDEIHNTHSEIYAIRDKLNDVNQKATDKQTSAIIIDSSIPQTEMNTITSDLPVSIYFDREDLIHRHFKIKDIENISKNNYASEITFNSPTLFSNSTILSGLNKPRFIYHGNRRFSLGLIGFDPTLETGRLYLISNDKAVYENNELTDNKKAPRTIARICDIPTNFSQLVNIKNLSPTLLIDIDYVRTYANFSTELKNRIYNISDNRIHMLRKDNKILIDNSYDIDEFDNPFNRYINLNNEIDISNNDIVTFDIDNGGIDYAIDDTFLFYIGGLCIKGTIITVDESGKVTEISLYNPSMGKTKISNIKNKISFYNTENISSNGNGLKIQMTINTDYWNNNQMITNGYLDDIFYLQKDHLGNIWSWSYTNNGFVKQDQITGGIEYVNKYDDVNNVLSTTDVFIYNELNNSNEFNSYEVYKIINDSSIPKTLDIKPDLSSYINKELVNIQDGLFIIHDGNINSYNYTITSYENCKNDSFDYTIPSYSDLNLKSYTNKTNKLLFNKNEVSYQPSLFIYDPTKNTVDTLSKISKDIDLKLNHKSMTFADIIDEDMIENNKLKYNVYTSNEFSIDKHIQKRNNLKLCDRNTLIDIIRNNNENSYPLKYENTKYMFSENMLINYIMENNIIWNDEEVYYTNNENPSIYRRNNIRLLRSNDDDIYDATGTPIGEQPTGGMVNVTSTVHDIHAKIDNTTYNSYPLFIFRIDSDTLTSLSNYRIYDINNIDISDKSIIILNNELYIANISKDGLQINWIKCNVNNVGGDK